MKNFVDYTSRKCLASARVASPRLRNITHTRKISFSGLVIQITMDGTFNYCTKFFLQLFTIHNIKNGHYIPLAFCLLPDKCTQTYRDVLLLIMTECSKLNLTFCPKHVVADFEKAIHNAVSAVWPASIPNSRL
jgi:hypothetical protein